MLTADNSTTWPKKKTVSIIILSCTSASALSETLSSVLGQTYPYIECIVVDSTADVGCLTVVEAAGNRIAHFNSELVENRYELVDKAIPFVTSQFIYVIESGWKLHSANAIESILNMPGEFDIIYGNHVKVYLFGDNKNEVSHLADNLTVRSLLHSMTDVFASSLVSTSLYKQIPLYEPGVVFNVGWFFILRIALQTSSVVRYNNVDLIEIGVGRHGALHRLSNVHQVRTERMHLLKSFFPSHSVDFGNEQSAENTLNSVSGTFTDKVYKNVKAVATKVRFNLRSLASIIGVLYYKANYTTECFDVPIIINNKNHITYLKRLINSLEKRGYHNIYIIDNNSTYEPLLEFYKESAYKVFYLKENIGYCALWDTEIFDLFKDKYYIYTDSDLEIVDECPDDFVVLMRYLLDKYDFGKVGLSLPIDDLPTHFANAAEVKKWEIQFSTNKIEYYAYHAHVDTTFALYRPNVYGFAYMVQGCRTAFPYSARHLPWYENTSSLTQEQLFYYKNASSSTHWSKKIKSVLNEGDGN